MAAFFGIYGPDSIIVVCWFLFSTRFIATPHHNFVRAGMVASAANGKFQLAILGISRVLMKTATPAETEKEVPEWLRKLVMAQASVMERVGAAGDERTLSRATKILEGGLKSHAYLLDVYLDVLTTEENSGNSLVALSAVAAFALALPQYNGKCRINIRPLWAGFSIWPFHTYTSAVNYNCGII